VSEQVYRQPVPAPGHLRRAGLSQSPPEQVPRQCLRQNWLAGLERHNATLVRPRSVRRCVARSDSLYQGCKERGTVLDSAFLSYHV